MNLEIGNEEIKIKKANKFLDFAAKSSLVFRNHKSKIVRDKFLKLILQNLKTDFLKFEIRNQKSEIRNQKSEIRNQKSDP